MFIYPWLLVTEKSDSGLNIDFQLNILKFCFSRVDNQGFVRTRFRILKNRLDPGKTGVLYVNVKNSGCLKSDLIQLRKNIYTLQIHRTRICILLRVGSGSGSAIFKINRIRNNMETFSILCYADPGTQKITQNLLRTCDNRCFENEFQISTLIILLLTKLHQNIYNFKKIICHFTINTGWQC